MKHIKPPAKGKRILLWSARSILSLLLCLCLAAQVLTPGALATNGSSDPNDDLFSDENYVGTWDGKDYYVDGSAEGGDYILIGGMPAGVLPSGQFSWGWTEYFDDDGSGGGGGSSNSNGSTGKKPGYRYETASNAEEIIAICEKYSDMTVTTGVRNQIYWMRQLYSAAVDGYCSQLSPADALLIALLNHTSINTTLMKTDYSLGDINRAIAGQIADGAEGYATVEEIAAATGLKVKDVRDILRKIARGSVTENTIAAARKNSSYTTRGAYLKNQAQKQGKVYKYLQKEAERMAADADALQLLCDDLGGGYVNALLSGYKPDQYLTMLYERYLASVLDNTLESGNAYSVGNYDISKTDAYKVTKKVRSTLSGVFSYNVDSAAAGLSAAQKEYLTEHLKNGILSEKEAREYLILSGQYEAGENGIGEAAKQLANGCKHLQQLKKALDVSGNVIKTLDKIQKAEDLIDYWATDFAEQEVLLAYLVEDLSQSGADAELLIAAKELQREYGDKLSGTFDRIGTELVTKGIGTVKSTFPPLGIAEAAISLGGAITGADKKVGALETGLAMQGICKQALADYEAAVKAVGGGDHSDEAVSRVMTTYELARQSLVSYYKAMITLAETDTAKAAYERELEALKTSQFGIAVVKELPTRKSSP